MRGNDRVLAALRGEKSDKIPVMLHNFMHAAFEANISMSEYRENPKKMAEVHIRSVERYGYDGACIDMDTVTLAGALGVVVDLPENDPGRCHKGIVDDLSVVDKLPKVDIAGYRYVQNWLEGVRLIKEHFGEDLSVRGNCDQAPYSLAGLLRGMESWMMDMFMGSEEQVNGLLAYCAEATCQFVDLMAQTGADVISNGDSTAGPELLQPELYRKYAVPYEKMVVERAHRNSLPYILHICGNTDLILPDMVSTGTDAVELDYKTDIRKAYSLLSDDVTFIGNIDPSGVLALGSVSDVERKVNELLSIYGKSNRFILNAGCAIPASTPTENMKMFMKTVREFR